MHGIIERFKKIQISNKKKPLVGIVGDVFVRCNTYANEHVVEEIERLGDEAWLRFLGPVLAGWNRGLYLSLLTFQRHS